MLWLTVGVNWYHSIYDAIGEVSHKNVVISGFDSIYRYILYEYVRFTHGVTYLKPAK